MVNYWCVHAIYKWNIRNIKLAFLRKNKKSTFREPHLKCFIRVTALLALSLSAQQKRCKHSVNKFFFRFLNLAKKVLASTRKKKKIMFFLSSRHSMCFAACILFQVSILLPCPRSEITPLFIRIPLSSVWHTIAAYSSSSTTVVASSICWLFLPVSNRERGNTEREEGWWMGGSFRVTRTIRFRKRERG